LWVRAPYTLGMFSRRADEFERLALLRALSARQPWCLPAYLRCEPRPQRSGGFGQHVPDRLAPLLVTRLPALPAMATLSRLWRLPLSGIAPASVAG
jgi:hypothetical protein